MTLDPTVSWSSIDGLFVVIIYQDRMGSIKVHSDTWALAPPLPAHTAGDLSVARYRGPPDTLRGHNDVDLGVLWTRGLMFLTVRRTLLEMNLVWSAGKKQGFRSQLSVVNLNIEGCTQRMFRG